MGAVGFPLISLAFHVMCAIKRRKPLTWWTIILMEEGRMSCSGKLRVLVRTVRSRRANNKNEPRLHINPFICIFIIKLITDSYYIIYISNRIINIKLK